MFYKSIFYDTIVQRNVNLYKVNIKEFGVIATLPVEQQDAEILFKISFASSLLTAMT